MKILFTGVGRRVELIQAFRNAALELNVNLKIYGADITETAPALQFCDEIVIVPRINNKSYIPFLIDYCKNNMIDALIPTIDTDLLILSKNKNKFEKTKVIVSDTDKIAICRDKRYTSDFFNSVGLKSPKPVDDYMVYDGGFPAFIKPKDGSSSIFAYKIDNEYELKEFAYRVPDYIVQPFISGKEYTIDIFCDWNGNPISIVPRERMQVRAGEVLKTRIELDSVMIEESRRLCASFKPCGPMTVQLIRDNTGVDWFIEINPRFGGGAPLSMKAGARSAETIIKMLLGKKVDYVTSVANGAVYSRFDQSVCITEEKNKIKGVIFDLDDTLYSEKEYIQSGFKAVSDYLGGEYEMRLWNFFNDGKPAIDELLKEINRETKKNAVLDVYRFHKPNIHLYDGVQKLIEDLKSKGIKVGIITDGRPEGQRNKLEALNLNVDDVIITDELGGSQFRKPCDIAFRIMMLRWKLNPTDIVYVGDNPAKDFQAPRQLGMKSIYFKNLKGLYCNNRMNLKVPTINEFKEITKIII